MELAAHRHTSRPANAVEGDATATPAAQQCNAGSSSSTEPRGSVRPVMRPLLFSLARHRVQQHGARQLKDSAVGREREGANQLQLPYCVSRVMAKPKTQWPKSSAAMPFVRRPIDFFQSDKVIETKAK